MPKKHSFKSLKPPYVKESSNVSFGFESSFIRRWDSAKKLQMLYQGKSARVVKSFLVPSSGNYNIPSTEKYQSSTLPSKPLHSAAIRWKKTEEKVPQNLRGPSWKNDVITTISNQKNGLASPNGQNTFGTWTPLKPAHRTTLDVSMDSLPPPPSPRTLRRVMSFS